MYLNFPGTKGEIEESSRKHKFNTSLIIGCESTKILIDYGELHSPDLEKSANSFDGILITHAHPDHYVWTIKPEKIIKIPVYLTQATLDYSVNKPINPKIIEPGKTFKINNISVTPISVIHSIRCPAVCYKIKCGKTIIYAPDILDVEGSKEEILEKVDFFIGDGSSINVNLVRRRGDKLFGHAMIKTIMNWCKKYSIENLIITHCGKQVVTSNEKELEKKLLDYSEGKINFIVAFDGMELVI